MPRYRDSFKLDPEDLHIIEDALRVQEARAHGGDASAPCPRAVRSLLGRLHEQKIFYAYTRAGGVPNG